MTDRRDGPAVIVLGAGATKACGGPLTNEILPEAFNLSAYREQQLKIDLIDEFLIEHFHLDSDIGNRQFGDYPSLPLVMSLIDVAIDRKHAFGAQWGVERMADLRHALDLAIFCVIQTRLERLPANPQKDLFRRMHAGKKDWAIISLNYDTIPDNALVELAGGKAFADYGCDIAVPTSGKQASGPRQTFGRLLKLHGSLNWHYCPNCQRLELGISAKGNSTIKVLHKFIPNERGRLLEERYQSDRENNRCTACGAVVRPVLISPSLYKDYRNPHIGRIWYEAERLLQKASRVAFIGYSFPDDDVHVAYLMKRALQNLDSREITVLGRSADPSGAGDPAYERYRALFGRSINWNGLGFDKWLASPHSTKFC